MQTRSQKYAVAVYKKVSVYEQESQKAKRIGIIAHNLPILVQKAGLAQALAFVSTRQGVEDREFLEDLAKVVGCQNGQELLSLSRNAGFRQYMYLTSEVMTALEWFKRFSVSVLKVKVGDSLDDFSGGS